MFDVHDTYLTDGPTPRVRSKHLDGLSLSRYTVSTEDIPVGAPLTEAEQTSLDSSMLAFTRTTSDALEHYIREHLAPELALIAGDGPIVIDDELYREEVVTYWMANLDRYVDMSTLFDTTHGQASTTDDQHRSRRSRHTWMGLSALETSILDAAVQHDRRGTHHATR